MAGESLFDLDRLVTQAIAFEHVVVAAREPEEAVLVEIEIVAGARPLADERLARFVVFTPVEEARGLALDPGFARHVGLGPVAVLGRHDADLVAEYRLAEAAALEFLLAIGDPLVGDLGAADRVEQLNAKLFVKAGKDFRRDFFRGAGDEIERGKIRLRAGLPHILENIFQHRRYGGEPGHLGARHPAPHPPREPPPSPPNTRPTPKDPH